jgi:hypothetical protein
MEVRDYSVDEKRQASHLPLHRLVAPIGPQRAASEVPLEVQQDFIAVAIFG